MPRDYKQERERYDGLPHVMAKNRARHRARYAMEKAGLAHRNDGKDVNHKDGSTKNNNLSNLEAISPRANRSFPRNSKAGKKNPKD